MSKRAVKLSKHFQHIIADIIAAHVEFDKNILVTVVHAALSSDLSRAKIWLSVLPFAKSEAAINTLIVHKQLIIEILNQEIKLRKMPRLIFLIDDTEEKATAMEKQINQLFIKD